MDTTTSTAVAEKAPLAETPTSTSTSTIKAKAKKSPIAAKAAVEEKEKEKEKKKPLNMATGGVEKAKKRKARSSLTFSTHIYKVMKAIHAGTGEGKGPCLGIKRVAMDVMDGIVKHMYHEICTAASQLRAIDKVQGITVNHLRSACHLVFPGDLCKHALLQGSEAVRKYSTHKGLLTKEAK